MLCLNLTCHVLEISASIRASDDGQLHPHLALQSYCRNEFLMHRWPHSISVLLLAPHPFHLFGHFIGTRGGRAPLSGIVKALFPYSATCSRQFPAADTFPPLELPFFSACLGAFSDTRSLARAIEVGTEGGLLSQGQTSTSWGGSGETNTPDSPSPARQGFPKGWSPPHPLGDPAP